MGAANKKTIFHHFESIKDPRVDRTKKHALIDILIIVICATISGAEGWDEIEEFGMCKEEWFRHYLKLANGIPSADTFRRVLSRVNPLEFQQRFYDWLRSIFSAEADEKFVAIDGKKSGSSKDPIHVVSAWAQKHAQDAAGVFLGQQAVSDKSNEITAIPSLLRLLDLKGATITIDAIGCQKEIAKQIVGESKADYCIAVKANQPELYQTIQEFFDEHVPEMQIPVKHHEAVDTEHGRIEHRCYSISSDIAWFPCLKDWPSIKSVGVAENWTVKNGKETTEKRYYITSFKADAQTFATAVRSHWGIENKLHWNLDVNFNEDNSKISDRNAQQNLTLIRKLSLSMLQKVKEKYDSFKRMRKRCGWENDYLLKVLLS